MKYEFTQDKTGCPNGRDVVEFKKGEVIEGEKVGEYLFAKWLEQGIIKKVKKDEGTCRRNQRIHRSCTQRH